MFDKLSFLLVYFIVRKYFILIQVIVVIALELIKSIKTNQL